MNYAEYEMRVKGKEKDIVELYSILNEGDYFLSSCYFFDIKKIDNNYYYGNVLGEVKGSALYSMMIYNPDFTIIDLSKKLNLTIEILSREIGMNTVEHLAIENGEVLTDINETGSMIDEFVYIKDNEINSINIPGLYTDQDKLLYATVYKSLPESDFEMSKCDENIKYNNIFIPISIKENYACTHPKDDFDEILIVCQSISVNKSHKEAFKEDDFLKKFSSLKK